MTEEEEKDVAMGRKQVSWGVRRRLEFSVNY